MLKTVSAFLITLCYGLCFAQTGLSVKAKTIFPSQKSEVLRSAIAVRLSDGVVVYSETPNLSLVPASVSKLAVAVMALEKYGTHHQFETHFYHSGTRQNSTILGDLIVEGSGDPMIINENLWQLAADFKHLGIEKIQGDIVIDNTLFSDSSRGFSRKGGTNYSSVAYDAPISAFGVNFNTFPVAIAPAEKLGQKALVSIDPYPINGIRAINQAETGTSSRLRVSRHQAESATIIRVGGKIASNAELKKYYRSVGDPQISAGETLKAFLEQSGIQITGKVKNGLLDRSAAKKIYTLKGFPLTRIVEGLNKYSNNYIADMLTKKISVDFHVAEANEAPGSLASGKFSIESFLKKQVGLKPPFEIYNGSGLDIRNRLSATQLVQLLIHASKQPNYFPELLASLPIAGVDASLKDRFKKAELAKLRGQIRAKTGTLSDPVSVSSLAGYIHHPKQGLHAFVIIENGVVKKPQPNLMDLRYGQEQALWNLWNRL